uniref:ATP synthase F0 subunit 8 n=1 Tax=Ixodes tasmani TaxID=59654 RepID=A0A3R5X1K6_9ACAR|nr:ATP synthase F0 subunit 8 [Ixodes tasmani]QAB05979.1 ATP synthase F0 subunit 8 [Ixodes tasmani]
MPQLFPMNWMILLIMFSMIYIMILMIIYFFPMMSPFISPKIKFYPFFPFKW